MTNEELRELMEGATAEEQGIKTSDVVKHIEKICPVCREWRLFVFIPFIGEKYGIKNFFCCSKCGYVIEKKSGESFADFSQRVRGENLRKKFNDELLFGDGSELLD